VQVIPWHSASELHVVPTPQPDGSFSCSILWGDGQLGQLHMTASLMLDTGGACEAGSTVEVEQAAKASRAGNTNRSFMRVSPF
jgi:hypothetical protein